MKNTAIITGAARNIGMGIAKTLLENDYSCILVDKDEPELQKTKTKLSRLGDCREYVADIGAVEQIDDFLKWLQSETIEITALINNVAYESECNILTLTPEDMQMSNAINLEGPFYLSSKLSQKWVENSKHGNLIFITSTHSKVTRMHPLYSSSKAAIEMFVKEGALELASHNIRVNAIAPGVVQDTEELLRSEYMPLGFNQQPKDIGEAVAFLLSTKARFITGQTLVIDGGFSLAHTHYWMNKGKL